MDRITKEIRCLESGIVKLYGKLVTTTGGAVDTTNTKCKGFSIAKTASEVGRYTVTLSDKYNALLSVLATIIGTADTAYTTAKGIVYFLRNVDMANKSFQIQFAEPQTAAADAELQDGASVLLEFTLKNSSVDW